MPRPPANPDQLRASRDAFAAASAGLQGWVSLVRSCAIVDGWVGATQDAYRARMAAIAQRILRAAQALHDAAAAFGELADRLEDAHPPGRGLTQSPTPQPALEPVPALTT